MVQGFNRQAQVNHRTSAVLAVLCAGILSFLLVSSVHSAPITYQESLPAGNFQEKCSDCEINGSILQCQCSKPGKKFQNRTFPRTLDMNLCSEFAVKEVDGALICDNEFQPEENDESDRDIPIPPPLETAEDLPPGDYRSYCQQCRYEDGQLKCSCKISGYFFSSWYESTLPLDSCSTTDKISYARGILFCNEEEMLKFLSKQLRRCVKCTVKGNDLDCTCKKTNCDWSNSDLTKKRNIRRHTLSGFRNCTADIINCNGYVRCGSCNTGDFLDEYLRPHEGRSAKGSCPGWVY